MMLGALGQTTAQQSCVPIMCNPGVTPASECQQIAPTWTPNTPPYTGMVPSCPTGYKLGNPLAVITGTSTGFPTSMVTTTPTGNVVTSYNPSTGIITTPSSTVPFGNIAQYFGCYGNDIGCYVKMLLLLGGGALVLLLLLTRSGA